MLLWLDLRLGLLTLSTMPALFIVRLFWLPRAKVAFMAAHETNSIANGALAEGIHGVRTVQSLEARADAAEELLKTRESAAEALLRTQYEERCREERERVDDVVGRG